MQRNTTKVRQPTVKDYFLKEQRWLNILLIFETGTDQEARYRDELLTVESSLRTLNKSCGFAPKASFLEDHQSYIFQLSKRAFAHFAHLSREACKCIDYLSVHATEINIEACRKEFKSLYTSCVPYGTNFQEFLEYVKKLRIAQTKVSQGQQTEASYALNLPNENVLMPSLTRYTVNVEMDRLSRQLDNKINILAALKEDKSKIEAYREYKANFIAERKVKNLDLVMASIEKYNWLLTKLNAEILYLFIKTTGQAWKKIDELMFYPVGISVKESREKLRKYYNQGLHRADYTDFLFYVRDLREMLDQCQLEEKQKRDEALKTPDSKKAKVADLWCSQFNQNPECVTPGVIHLDLPSVKNR